MYQRDFHRIYIFLADKYDGTRLKIIEALFFDLLSVSCDHR